MKNLQIETVQRFKVGSREFFKMEDAQKYIDKENSSTATFYKNRNLLEEFKDKGVNYIPVTWKDSETEDVFFDFLFEDGDGNSGIHWRGLFHCDSLRYLYFELSVVAWDNVLPLLHDSLDSFCHLDTSDMHLLIDALTQEQMEVFTSSMNSVQLLDTLRKIQFNPVYIHD